MGTSSVWTGRELLVWSGTAGTYGNFFSDGAAYDPAADRWRAMAPWPGRISDGVWTGREMVVWGGTAPAPAGGRDLPVESPADGGRYVP